MTKLSDEEVFLPATWPLIRIIENATGKPFGVLVREGYLLKYRNKRKLQFVVQFQLSPESVIRDCKVIDMERAVRELLPKRKPK